MSLRPPPRSLRPMRQRRPGHAAPAGSVQPVPGWAQLVAEELGGRIGPTQVTAWGRAATVATPLAALVLLGPVVAVLVAALLVALPRLAEPALARRRVARRDQQLTGALERIAASVRAGASIAAAIDVLADEVDGPLAGELATIAGATRHGVPLRTALDAWIDASAGSRDVALAGAALSLGAQAGGPIARAIDGVAATLRERRQLQAEVRALATQARASAWLLAVAPVGFAALMSTVEPRALEFLISSPAGWLCLAAGIGLDAIGALWMQRLVGRAT